MNIKQSLLHGREVHVDGKFQIANHRKKQENQHLGDCKRPGINERVLADFSDDDAHEQKRKEQAENQNHLAGKNVVEADLQKAQLQRRHHLREIGKFQRHANRFHICSNEYRCKEYRLLYRKSAFCVVLSNLLPECRKLWQNWSCNPNLLKISALQLLYCLRLLDISSRKSSSRRRLLRARQNKCTGTRQLLNPLRRCFLSLQFYFILYDLDQTVSSGNKGFRQQLRTL